MILEDYLYQNAQLYPDKIAVICGDKSLTYSELSSLVTQKADELKTTANKSRVKTFRASQDIDFLVTYFALHVAGFVAAPLEKDTPEVVFQDVTEKLTSCEMPNDAADILYTTGTTGKSKGVIISHKTIIANAENLIDGQGFTHDLLFIITGPLNHIGSLSKIYPIIITGATLVITEGMKNVNNFFNAMDLPYKKVATFLVPSAIRILLQLNAEKLAHYANKIDFIETGAAPISAADMQKLCEILPHSRLYNTYASTETGIIATYNFNDGKCLAGCLGRPMKHSQIVIAPDGLISCKGDTLMSCYAGDNNLTEKVLHDNAVFTSDYGKINDDGMLILYGREDDVINVGGYKVAPTEVENIAMSLPQISDCICTSAQHKILGTVLKLIFVTVNNQPTDIKAIAMYMKNQLESYKVPFYYEQTDTIKRTFNGKTDRKFYKLKVEN